MSLGENPAHVPRPGLVLAATSFVLGLVAGALIAPAWRGHQAIAYASIAGVPGPRTGQPADVLRILDGDTFEARVHVWPGIDITTKVRLRNIDTPELRARCPEERVKAEAAREALRVLLEEGDVMIMRVRLDKYGGRVVAEAGTRMTPDVGAAMIAQGLARPYAGGRRESWCPDGS
jgi:endonuclease YncB( thermonuclease family)